MIRDDALDDVFERMSLGLLEIVPLVHWIEPHVKHKLGPVTLPYDKSVWHEPVLVLRNGHVDLVARNSRERLYDAIWWDDGHVDEHVVLELFLIHNVALDAQIHVHNERFVVDVEEVGSVGIVGHGITHGGHFCPGRRAVFQRGAILLSVREECPVSMLCRVLNSVRLDRLDELRICRFDDWIDSSDDHDIWIAMWSFAHGSFRPGRPWE